MYKIKTTYIGTEADLLELAIAADDLTIPDDIHIQPGYVFINKTDGAIYTATMLADESKKWVRTDNVAGVGGAPSTFINGVVLAQNGWSLVSGLYEYSYSNSTFLSTSVVNVVPVNASMSTVQTAIMYPLVTVSTGSIKMYCQNAPQAAITINITVST